MEADRAWMLPEESVPIRLMSTVWADTKGIHDDLESVADLAAWLAAVGFPATHPDHEDLDCARALRDSARRLAAFVTSDTREPAASAMSDVGHAIACINTTAAQRSQQLLTRSGDELRLRSRAWGPPTQAALAEIAEGTRELLGTHSDTLRACNAPGCVLYFVKTHPRREWCSVACGNRARAARHYQNVRIEREPEN